MLDKKERINYIDIFRAFGIILMVMGHVFFGDLFDHLIHAFHMPMFFFITGFLHKDRQIPFSDFLLKKAKTLLLPYFVFGAFHYLVNGIINGFSVEPIKALLIYPTGEGMPIAGALWFLIALFIADIIYYWIDRISDNRIRWTVVVILALAGQIVPAKAGITVPFALDSALVGIGLMHIGRELRKCEKQITNLKIYQILLFGAVICYSIIKSDYVNMRTGTYPDSILLFWVNAVASSIILLNVAKQFDVILKNCIINKYLRSVGRNTIVYLCLNQFAIMVCRLVRTKLAAGLPESMLVDLLNHTADLILALILLFLLSLLFEKTFFRVLVGKFEIGKKQK